MSKKKIIIIIIAIFSVFTIVFTVLMVNSHKNKEKENSFVDDLRENAWAVNDVKDEKTEAEIEAANSRTVYDVTYDNLNLLTREQISDADNFYQKVKKTAERNAGPHIEVSSVSVLDTSNEAITYVEVTYVDDYKQTYLLVYDDITEHKYLNCVTQEEWDYCHSFANLG